MTVLPSVEETSTPSAQTVAVIKKSKAMTVAILFIVPFRINAPVSGLPRRGKVRLDRFDGRAGFARASGRPLTGAMGARSAAIAPVTRRLGRDAVDRQVGIVNDAIHLKDTCHSKM